jgi:hypothetical protein
MQSIHDRFFLHSIAITMKPPKCYYTQRSRKTEAGTVLHIVVWHESFLSVVVTPIIRHDAELHHAKKVKEQ